MTAATKRRPRTAAKRRLERADVRVRARVYLPGFVRESAEVRVRMRDVVRDLIKTRLPSATVEQRVDQGIVITTDYHGPALNAGPLTAAAWLLYTLDECVPEDSPLAELLAGGQVDVSTKHVR